MRDLGNNSTRISLVDAQATGGTLQIVGSYVDSKGEARNVLALANLNISGANTVSITLEEADTSNTNAGATTLSTLISAATSDTKATSDLALTKRFIRARVVFTSPVDSSTVVSVWGVFYNERFRPSNVA